MSAADVEPATIEERVEKSLPTLDRAGRAELAGVVRRIARVAG